MDIFFNIYDLSPFQICFSVFILHCLDNSSIFSPSGSPVHSVVASLNTIHYNNCSRYHLFLCISLSFLNIIHKTNPYQKRNPGSKNYIWYRPLAKVSPLPVHVHDIYAIWKSKTSLDQHSKRFMCLLSFLCSCTGLNPYSTKNHSLCDGSPRTKYLSASILQENSSNENQMGQLETSLYRTPQYSVSQPPVAHSLINKWQKSNVHHSCTALRRSVLAHSQQDVQPDSDEWLFQMIGSPTFWMYPASHP